MKIPGLGLNRLTALAVGLLPILSACSSDTADPLDPGFLAVGLPYASDTSSYYPIRNTASDRLALEIDGFGGAYIDDGAFNIRLVGPTTELRNSQALEAVEALFDSLDRPLPEVRFLAASYTFKQLRIWEYKISRSRNLFGIVSIGVQARTNTLRIGISDLRHKAELLRLYAEAGIPSEALLVVEEQPLSY